MWHSIFYIFPRCDMSQVHQISDKWNKNSLKLVGKGQGHCGKLCMMLELCWFTYDLFCFIFVSVPRDGWIGKESLSHGYDLSNNMKGHHLEGAVSKNSTFVWVLLHYKNFLTYAARLLGLDSFAWIGADYYYTLKVVWEGGR